MKIIIDGLQMKSEDDFHEIIGKKLYSTEYYGKNLDALWDVLTGMAGRPLTIIWKNSIKSQEIFPRYEKIIKILKEVEEWDESIGVKDRFNLILE